MKGRLTNRVATWIEEALDKHALADKDHVTWEIQFAMTQQGPQIGLVMWMPSGIIGQLVTSIGVVENPAAVTTEEVEDLVVQSLEGLRKARSEALANVGA